MTCLYWFTLNQVLHLVFLETTGESTKQSTLDYLQHHQRSDLDPLKTHFLWLSTNTTKNVDLDNLKNTHHFSASHTKFLQSTKGLHLLQKRSEINTRWKSYITLSLIKAISKQSPTLQKQNQWKTQICFFIYLLNLSSCLLHKLNKLFIAFKDWSKHLNLERNQL